MKLLASCRGFDKISSCEFRMSVLSIDITHTRLRTAMGILEKEKEPIELAGYRRSMSIAGAARKSAGCINPENARYKIWIRRDLVISHNSEFASAIFSVAIAFSGEMEFGRFPFLIRRL